MKVSVLIASNRLEFIADAMASLNEQTVKPDEVLYHYDPTLGFADKINAMFKRAKGDAFLVLSDDDKLEKTFIEKTVKLMKESGKDIVYTDMQLFGDKSWIEHAGEYTLQAFKATTPIYITSLFKREVFEDVGDWDKDVDFQDWDFWYRAFKCGKTAIRLPETLFHYRWHGQNWDYRKGQAQIRSKHKELND